MFKIAYKLVLSRKWWLTLIVGSIALILAGTMSIFYATETIKSNLKEKAYQQFGEHTGLIFDVNTSKNELIGRVDALGEYGLSDILLLENNKIVTVGWFDTDAIEVGRIQVKEGRLPTTKNEIVIEESYKKLLEKQFQEEWKIGTSKSLEFGKGKSEVVLTGIIKDYSSNWTVPEGVKKGENDFPNILTIISENSHRGYLFKMNGSKENSIKKSSEIINEYGREGYINSRLFDKGLIDYDTISSLSLIFQMLLLVLSLIMMVTMISFYNSKDIKKLAIFKAVGAETKKIFMIKVYQYFIILGLSILCSVPLAIVFALIIINNTYNNGFFGNVNWLYIFALVMVNVLLIVVFFIVKNFKDVNRLNQYSIISLIKGDTRENNITKLNNIRNFNFQQLAIQLTSNKKITILTTLSLTFTILLLVVSIFVQKETEGIWNGDTDYFISTQEIYYQKNIDNMTVLKEQGLTVSEKDINRIEELPYVSQLIKKPFMVDVHLLMDKKDVNQSIRNWLNIQGVDAEFNNKIHIPNIEYRILNSNEFNEIYPNMDFEDFKGKVILGIPNSTDSDKSIQIKEVTFAKKILKENNIETKTWEYQVFDVLKTPHNQSESFIVLLDNETAEINGISPGYHEVSITVDENISNSQKVELESILNELVSTTPGSLYQIVSEFKIEDTQISVMFGFLGKFSFIICVILNVIAILIIIKGKYEEQKFRWGIYMTLGMSKWKVLKQLSLEMLFYLIAGAAFSGVIFFLIISATERYYPLVLYVSYYILSIGFILLLLLIGIYFIKVIIKENSIFQMLRRDE